MSDRIYERSEIYPPEPLIRVQDMVDAMLKSILHWDRRTLTWICDRLSNSYKGRKQLLMSYRRTTTGGGSVPQDMENVLDNDILAFEQYQRQSRQFLLSYMSGCTLKPVSKVVNWMNIFGNGNCIGNTRGGRLCLIPDTALNGDMLAVVRGLPVPLIPQPIDGGHRLVGYAYVHSIMNEEVFKSHHGSEDRIKLY